MRINLQLLQQGLRFSVQLSADAIARQCDDFNSRLGARFSTGTGFTAFRGQTRGVAFRICGITQICLAQS